MTVADVVAQVCDGRLDDFVREAVALVARELMESEIAGEVGAELGEVCAYRVTHRNGYRPRAWETRVGEIELLIPRKRQGPAYFPSFLEPRRRSEQAIVAVVLEAYVNGVSTRKVDRLVEQLGIDGMTKDRVSALCRGLDEHVEAFRTRPLEGAYPYLWLDAKHVKVRDRGRVVSKAVVIAYAVHESGVREVLDLDVGEVESGAFWREFLLALKRRGLHGVQLVISDAHEGLKAAIARVLACPWQRCTVRREDAGPARPAATSAASSAPPCERSSTPTTRRRPRNARPTCSPASRRSRRKSASCSKTAEEDPDRLLRAPLVTIGPKLRGTNRSSASTERSAAAPTSSGSSPTTKQRSASPARCWPSRTMSGSSAAATSPSNQWPSSSMPAGYSTLSRPRRARPRTTRRRPSSSTRPEPPTPNADERQRYTTSNDLTNGPKELSNRSTTGSATYRLTPNPSSLRAWRGCAG